MRREWRRLAGGAQRSIGCSAARACWERAGKRRARRQPEAGLARAGIPPQTQPVGTRHQQRALLPGVIAPHPGDVELLPGKQRQLQLLKLAQTVPAPRDDAKSAELARASEVMLCGSTTDVTPVVRIDGTPVGTGAPGPITNQLRAAFEARLYALAAAAR